MLNLMRETVRFEIVGISPERFLNIANRRRLRVFNVHCVGNRMFAFALVSQFDTLTDAASKAAVRLEITEHHGLPYLLRNYRKRIGFVMGFGVFCLLLWYLSLFVWFVDCVNVPEPLAASASDAVYNAGIRVGMLSSRIDGPQLELELEEELPQFDFIKVSRMGCRAQVYFSPSVHQKSTVSDETPCDLIATDGGEIVEVIAIEGTPLVQAGDIVYPGDTLVSGLFEGNFGGISMVHSQGKVTAMIDKTFSETIDCKQTIKEPTGKIITINRLLAFGWEIPLFYETPQGNYSRTYEEFPLTVGAFSLPVTLRREEWHELCYTEKIYTTEECTAQAEELLEKTIQEAEQSEIVTSTQTVNETPGGVRVTRYVTFLKEISEERGILLG